MKSTTSHQERTMGLSDYGYGPERLDHPTITGFNGLDDAIKTYWDWAHKVGRGELGAIDDDNPEAAVRCPVKFWRDRTVVGSGAIVKTGTKPGYRVAIYRT